MIKLFLAEELSSQLVYQIIIDYHHFKSVSLGKFWRSVYDFLQSFKIFQKTFGFRISMSWHPEWPHSVFHLRMEMSDVPDAHQWQPPMATFDLLQDLLDFREV